MQEGVTHKLLLDTCWAEPRGIANNGYYTWIWQRIPLQTMKPSCASPFWTLLILGLTLYFPNCTLCSVKADANLIVFTSLQDLRHKRCSVDVCLNTSELWISGMGKRLSCSKCYIHSVTNSKRLYWVSVEKEILTSFLVMSFLGSTTSELWSHMLVMASTLRLENNESSLPTPSFLQVASYWDTTILTYLYIVYNSTHAKMTWNLVSRHI